MGERVKGEYFGIFDNPEAEGNRPEQTGKLIVDADLLQALIDVGHAQQERDYPIEIEMNLGFWKKTGRDSNKEYLWGRPSVWVTDDPAPPKQRRTQRPQKPVAQKRSLPKEPEDEIPF
jgi:hypothetical protein